MATAAVQKSSLWIVLTAVDSFQLCNTPQSQLLARSSGQMSSQELELLAEEAIDLADEHSRGHCASKQSVWEAKTWHEATHDL